MKRTMASILGITVTAALSAGSAQAKIRTEVIEYKQGNTVLEGYIAFEDGLPGRRPAVLVVHDWMGVGPFVKKRIEELAMLGYVAFAPDIYGKGVRPKNTDEASKQAKLYRSDRKLMRARAQAGLDVLRTHPRVDAGHIAAMGYCFGGGVALELARSGAALTGAVSVHGNLDTPNPADARAIRAKVLVLHGADDPHVPPEQVAAFETEMRKAKVDWQFIAYGGAVHAFTNPEAGSDPSKGVAYNAAANRRSWEALKLFFAEVLGPTPG